MYVIIDKDDLHNEMAQKCKRKKMSILDDAQDFDFIISYLI